MVPRSHDQSKTADAGGYQAGRSGDRACGCEDPAQQPQSGYRCTRTKQVQARFAEQGDLADEAKNEAWCEYYKKQGIYAVRLDARNRAGMKQVQDVIQEACKEKLEKNRRRGILNRPVRAMVAGIPNVGKSTFINSFAGKACAKTGNKPGVTKGKQWIRLNKNVELLDTPGILWPKFDNQRIGLHLAYIGSIKDELLDRDEVAVSLIGELTQTYPGLLAKRYNLTEEAEPVKVLEKLAESRGRLKKGGELDCGKAAVLLSDDFRSGKLGRITIELPPV